MKRLTLRGLLTAASAFAAAESLHPEPILYGVTDGKAVGTYFEHKFHKYLESKFTYTVGSSAKGIDFPELEVDVKVTSVKQPQSSSPYQSASQKIYGLGYSLLIFVYDKTDDHTRRTGLLNVLHTIFVEKGRTGDFQTTSGIRRLLENDANEDDLLAFIQERNLPVDEIGASALAQRILTEPPKSAI